MLTFSTKLSGKNSISLLLRDGGVGGLSIRQAHLILITPLTARATPAHTLPYRTWGPKSLLACSCRQHSCSRRHIPTEGTLSTWAQAGITVMGKAPGMLITPNGVFNCKEHLAWTKRLYKRTEAAAGFQGCRAHLYPRTAHQHLSLVLLRGGLSIQVTAQV